MAATGTQYATLVELTSLGVPAASLTGTTSDQQTAALVAASSIVDSYVGARFKLPLSNYGADLKICVCKIAGYNLLTTRGMSPGNDAGDALRNAYKDQMAWLKDISDGRATPAWPVASDVNGYNPEGGAFVLQPASGAIGASGSSFFDGNSNSGGCSRVGTPQTPKLRGW